jgi:3-phenylpropionate/cinnamic acid dioxygenase small subunit
VTQSQVASGRVLHDREAIEQFLFQEADLLDTWQIDAWLALFAENAVYWVPSNAEDYDPRQSPSIVYDDRAALEDRVARLHSPLAHSQAPRSRTRRILGNVQVMSSTGDETRVSCNVILHEVRLNQEKLLSGRCEYVLRERDGVVRIASKKVVLTNNDVPLGNITFLL